MSLLRNFLLIICWFGNCQGTSYLKNSPFKTPYNANLFFFEQDFYAILKTTYVWLLQYSDFKTLRAAIAVLLYLLLLFLITLDYTILLYNLDNLCTYLDWLSTFSINYFYTFLSFRCFSRT